MKKHISLAVILLVMGISLSGCQLKNKVFVDQATPTPIENSEDTTQNLDEANATPQPTVSSSTEVQDLDTELNQTKIDAEVFTDL